jgi:predicted Zn-dependent protease
MRITHPLLLTALLGCVFLAVSCAKNPVTGNTDVTMVSKKGEIEQGRKAHEQVIRFYGIYDDQALQDYVTQIGTKLAQASERPELEWHFTVVDADDINAFALPGGYIYIMRSVTSPRVTRYASSRRACSPAFSRRVQPSSPATGRWRTSPTSAARRC